MVRPRLPLKRELMDFDADGARVRIAALGRRGELTPVVFLHGFGSTKEDYADAALQACFDGRTILALDAPGCGESECADLSALSLEMMCDVLKSMVRRLDLPPFHLVGHSMGGLTALLYAHRNAREIVSLTSIEGNLTPSDCFFSRQVLEYPALSDQAFLDRFVRGVAASGERSNALYAIAVKHKVCTGAVRILFRSIVEHSEHGALLEKFLAVPAPKLFMYGDANRSLVYLNTLADRGVCLAEIPECGHFPMYANPPAMWSALGAFISAAESGSTP